MEFDYNAMKMLMRKRIFRSTTLPLLLVLISLITCVLSSVIIVRNTEETAFDAVDSIVAQQIISLDASISGRLDVLDACSRSISSSPNFALDSEDTKLKLQISRDAASLFRVFSVSMDRDCFLDDGKRFTIPNRWYFDECQTKNRVIARLDAGVVFAEPYFVLAVPIRRGDRVDGLVAGISTMDSMRGMLRASSGENSFLSFVCNSAGKVILSSDSEYDSASLFDILGENGRLDGQLMSALSGGTAGHSKLILQGNRRYAVYAPMNINNWTLFCVIPTEVIDSDVKTSSANTFVTTGIVMLVSLFIMLYTYSSEKRSIRLINVEKEAFQAKSLELDSIVRSTPGGVFRYSADADDDRFDFISENMLALLGYTLEEFQKKFDNRFSHMVYADDRERTLSEINKQIESSSFDSCEYRIEKKNGELIWVHDVGHLVVDPAGKRWFYVVIVDISQQKLTEQLLRESNEENAIVIRQSGKSIVRYDLDANTATHYGDVTLTLGLPEFMPNYPESLFALNLLTKQSEADLRSMFTAMRKGERIGGENVRMLNVTGEYRWYRIDYTLVADTDGAHPRGILSLYDNTELLEKEFAYERLQSELSASIEDCFSYYEVNLSTGAIERAEGLITKLNKVDYSKITFFEYAKQAILSYVSREDVEKAVDFYEFKRLFSLYARNIRKDAYEFTSAAEGSLQWYKTTIQMVGSPYNDDVKAFILTTNIDASHRRQERLEQLARFDGLTMLINRATLDREIASALSRLAPGDHGALFMMDLDRFKQVNDTLGHSMGDEALKKAAAAFSGQFREGDIVGRFGGDEFMAFIPSGATQDAAKAKAAALVENAQFVIGHLTVTTSVGVIICDGASRTQGELYTDVDAALYRAKRAGRSQFCFGAVSGGEAREQAETANMSKAVQLTTLLENIDGGVVIAEVTDEVHVTYISPSFYKIERFKTEVLEKRGDELWGLVYPADTGLVGDTFHAAAASGTRDCVFRAGRAGSIWMQLRAMRLSVLDTGGVSVIGILTDVTSVKNTETNAKLTEERYRFAMELTGAMIWEVDIRTHTLYQSQDTSRAMGHAGTVFTNVPESMIDTDTIHPDSIAEYRRMYDDIYAGVEGKQYTVLSRNATGAYMWYRASFRILRDAQNAPIRSLGIVEPQPNVDAEMRAFCDEQLFISLVRPSLLESFIVNLSTGVVETDGLGTTSYEELRAQRKTRIYGEDIETFLSVTDIAGLIADFNGGRFWRVAEFRHMVDGEPRWTRLSFNLMRHPVSDDIYGFVYYHDVETRKEWELSANTAISRDSTTLLYTRDTFAAIAVTTIAGMNDSDDCAVTTFEFENLETLKSERGMEFGKRILSVIGKLCQFVIDGNVVVGSTDEEHIVFFRMGKLSKDGIYNTVKRHIHRIQMMLAQAMPDAKLIITAGISLCKKANVDFDAMSQQSLIAVDAARRMPGDNIAVYMSDSGVGEHAGSDATTLEHLYELRFQQQANLLRLAERDELTGLYNRSAFLHHVRSELDANPRAQYLLFRWDIDGFKLFSDVNGRERADFLLRDMATIAIDNFGEAGICGRVEADHFALFTRVGTITPEEIFSVITRGMSALPTDFRITCHAGVYEPVDPQLDATSMCDRALLALKSVKASYTTRIGYYDDKLRKRIMEEQRFSADIAPAFTRHQFVTYFQPQYNYETNEMIGVEALVRWMHPTMGMLTPGSFIPLFEKNGLITELDEYVWRETCKHIRRWLDMGLPSVPVAVNISRMDIYSSALCAKLTALLREFRLQTSMLRLEVTESAYVQNPEQLISVINELRQTGFTVEMDDFGSGYSSLNMLKDVPVDVLKLDMRFISSGLSDARAGNILSSVIRMAHWLKLPVLAEGVETQEQAEYLKSLNCLYMQGYYFAHPMPANEFETLLSTANPGGVDRYTATNLDAMAEFWNPSTLSSFDAISVDTGVCILDFCGDSAEIVRANDLFYHELGSTREEFTRRFTNMLDCFDDESRAKYKAMLEEAVRTGEKCECVVESAPLTTGAQSFRIHNTAKLLGKTLDRFPVYIAVKRV